MSELLSRTAAKIGDRGPADHVSSLERLVALRQAGDLSAEEFEQARRALHSGFDR